MGILLSSYPTHSGETTWVQHLETTNLVLHSKKENKNNVTWHTTMNLIDFRSQHVQIIIIISRRSTDHVFSNRRRRNFFYYNSSALSIIGAVAHRFPPSRCADDLEGQLDNEQVLLSSLVGRINGA